MVFRFFLWDWSIAEGKHSATPPLVALGGGCSGSQASPGVLLQPAHPRDHLTEPDHMKMNLEIKFQKGLMSLAPGVLGWGHVGKQVFSLIWHGPEPNKQEVDWDIVRDTVPMKYNVDGNSQTLQGC